MRREREKERKEIDREKEGVYCCSKERNNEIMKIKF